MAGTQHGDRLSLSGAGVAHVRDGTVRRGDHHFTVTLVLPDAGALAAQQRGILAGLAAAAAASEEQKEQLEEQQRRLLRRHGGDGGGSGGGAMRRGRAGPVVLGGVGGEGLGGERVGGLAGDPGGGAVPYDDWLQRGPTGRGPGVGDSSDDE